MYKKKNLFVFYVWVKSISPEMDVFICYIVTPIDWHCVADRPLFCSDWTHCTEALDAEPQRRSGECDLSSATWGRTYLALLRGGEL